MPSTPSRSIVLSNRPTEFQKQHSIVRGANGSIYFAPINRFALTLPPEITSEIFLHCLPDTDFIRPDVTTAPLLLCRICRQWRQIALDTPQLWASLYVELNWLYPWRVEDDEEQEQEEEQAEYRREEPLVEFAEYPGFFVCYEWISNARGMPLSVHVELIAGGPYDLIPSIGDVQEFLCMIGERSAQWRKIVLRVPPEYFDLTWPDDSESLVFPWIEHLAVPDAQISEMPWMLDNVRHESTTFPWLTHLAVPRAQISEVPWMSNIPWMQLTVFRSEKISVSECVHVLRNGPSLLSCTFHLEGESDSVRVASLPPLALQDLEITETTTELLTLTLLQHLTLPALQHLTLKFDTPRHTHRDFSRLISFVSRSSLRLQQLTLCLVPVPEALLIQCLSAFPSVVVLRLQLRQPTNGLLRHLQHDVDLLPHMQSLHIVQNFPHPTAPDTAGLFQMLADRWEDSEGRRRTQLRSFQFECLLGSSDEMWEFARSVRLDEKFRLLKRQGMQLDARDAYERRSWYLPRG